MNDQQREAWTAYEVIIASLTAERDRLRDALTEAASEIQRAHDGSHEQCDCEMHARFTDLIYPNAAEAVKQINERMGR